MGTACACPSVIAPPQTPRPPPPSHRLPSYSFVNSSRKFEDIRPQEKENIDESMDELLLLQNQLSGRINNYQQCNGLVSQRFDTLWPQYGSLNMQKVKDNSTIRTKKSNKAMRVSRDSNMPSPISNQNVKVNLSGDASNTDRTQQQKQQSCLLSQRSHILSDSIFTDRLIEKNKFYSKNNSINGIQLLQWKQSERCSYFLQKQNVQTILEQNDGNCNVKLVLQALLRFLVKHSINLVSYCMNPCGIKIYFNGMKRMFPLGFTQNSQPHLSLIIQSLKPLLASWNAAEMIFHLTGWIPEQLKMADITSFTGIFSRLATNLEEGNSLIYFSRTNKDKKEQVLLTKIDLKQGIVGINPCNNKLTVPPMFFNKVSKNGEQILVKIQHFVQFFDLIHLSWNPTIYDFIINRQSHLTKENSTNRYSLVIPPSSQDIEIRLFLQKHHTKTNEKRSTMVIKLLQFQSLYNIEQSSPVRMIQTDQNLISDVFIFESCKQKTQYLLTIEQKDKKEEQTQICCTITLLSFVQMLFDPIKDDSLLKQVSLQTIMSTQNAGFGINSPYFDKNLSFLVQTELDKLLVVGVQSPSQFNYQICLIPNPEGHKKLTKINLQTIINSSSISGEKNGSGVFSIKTNYSSYLLVINAFSSYEGQLDILLKLHGKQTSKEPLLTITQTHCQNQVLFSEEIKWLPTHSGPRKRLKSNCSKQFQPSQKFTDFFINPISQRNLAKGRYQFFIRSQSFKNWFNSVEGYEYKNYCEPPALSLAIYQITDDDTQYKKLYRIILDDAFYVPFGIGFWTQEIDLEEGMYRFVFPKMDKSFAVGTFGIVQC